jgi:hypothetical protein
MDTLLTGPSDVMIVEEVTNGCLQIRLYEFTKNERHRRCAIAMVASNEWAGQDKLIEFMSGLSKADARELFKAARENFVTYDWMEGRVVIKDE